MALDFLRMVLRFYKERTLISIPPFLCAVTLLIDCKQKTAPDCKKSRGCINISAISLVVRAYLFFIEGRDTSGKIVCFIVRLKRIPRLFVVWHGKSSVGIILSELIIPFFRPFFKDEKCRQKHAEFISEFCVFLFALSIGKFGWILENILMRICPLEFFFFHKSCPL